MKSKEQKRAESEARQDAYNELSIEERIAQTIERPGRSMRERERIMGIR